MAAIWRDLDQTPITAREATREWALMAHDILEEIAPRYGRSIAFDDLAHEVQRRSGIMTDLPTLQWVPDVLTEVGDRCQESGEPRLTELVDAPGNRSTDAVTPARLECHQAYGAKIPDFDAPNRRSSRGARSATTRTPRPKAAEPRRRPVCPSCFLEVPESGICDNCD
ncbi:hypothetical protein [Enemella dayhoffiae]|nr:hypothetical protein [Enemella dayhoffiae]